ncbi:MAG: S49 family peptidase, partial [Myxococcales bacterium]
MRTVFAILANLWALLWAVLLTPLRRLFAARADYLALELSGELPWRTRLRPFWQLGGRHRALRAPSLEALREKLELLARDPKLRGLVIKVEDLDVSGARLQAIRAALLRVREAGKELVFYGRSVELREYVLMSLGRIHAAPGGRLDVKGHAAELTVYGAVLARFGVKAHFFRRGEYKTAPETFTHAEVSQAQ